MGRFTDWLLRREPERGTSPLDFDQWVDSFKFGGLDYPILPSMTLPGSPAEEIGGDFRGLIEGAYKANGIVFACMLVRMLLFSEVRFQYRRLQNGRPGELFGSQDLLPLEKPWAGGTTGDLLMRMIQDADLAGNWYGVRRPGSTIQRLRPDWMTIVLGSHSQPDYPAGALDMELVGYMYQPGGPSAGADPLALLPEEVAHFAPIPDPAAHFRGMSWLTPVLREITADGAATRHKLKFFENGATPNTVVSLDPEIDQEAFEKWIEAFDKKLVEPYRTLYLGGGAEVKVVGSDLKNVDFKEVQGAGETRIAAAAGVPPVIVGLSEGLQAATYSNYSQARRRFADGTMRPLWRNAAGSLEQLVKVPDRAELWYDDRDIPFLQEDRKDAAEIQQFDAQAIKTLIDAGYEPDSVRDAVIAGDLSRLEHTGLFSVQLQPPGTELTPQLPAPQPNGDGSETDPAKETA